MSHLTETHLRQAHTITGWVVAPPRHTQEIDPGLLHSMFRGDVSVKIENVPAVEQVLHDLFGLSRGAIDWAGLIGAPDEAIVSVSAVQIPDLSTLSCPSTAAIAVRCEHFYIDDYGVELQISADLAGNAIIELTNFYLADFAPAGLGTLMFAKMVAAISRTFPGAARQLKTIAGRMLPEDEQCHGRRLVGYYVWASLGFDQELPQIYRSSERDPWSCLAEPPASMREGCQTLQDLLSREDGKDWWLENGRPAELWFDLRPDSRSRQVLCDRLRQKHLVAL